MHLHMLLCMPACIRASALSAVELHAEILRSIRCGVRRAFDTYATETMQLLK